jgi:hypothetical protein
MEEFDFDSDNEIGTSVSKLKSGDISDPNQAGGANYHVDKTTETDIDYEKIIESVKTPHTKKINMGQFAKNMEMDLKKFNGFNDFNRNLSSNKLQSSEHNFPDEPLPVNLTKNMINSNKQLIQEQVVVPVTKIESSHTIKTPNNNYSDVAIYMLIFMLLNNKFIIELIYSIPYIKTISSPYPNLIIRSFSFGIVLFLLKKFNYLN